MNIKPILGCALVAAAVTVAMGGVAGKRIDSEGDYPPHLQGVCTDGTSIWWSHTVELVRTDLKGKVLAHAKGLRSHHGDLCIVDGTLYVAVNHGQFNTENKADSWVYAYKGDDLSFIKKWKVPELCHGAGGMTYRDGRFFVIGGLPPTHKDNYVYEYTPDFTFVKRHVLKSGWTNLGIQTVDFSNGKFFFGCYGGTNKVTGEKVPSLTLVAPADLSCVSAKVEDNTSTGLFRLDGHLWKATIRKVNRDEQVHSKMRYTVAMVPVTAALEEAAR